MNLSTFQVVLLIFFGVMIIVGVLIFSGIIPIGNDNNNNILSGKVVLWGVLSIAQMNPVIDYLQNVNKDLTVSYVVQPEANLENNLVEAIAAGRGPDLVIFPHDLILKHKDKLSPWSYDSLSARQFQDTFADGASLYLDEKGAVALPLYVDPIVMYFNRETLSTAGIASSPSNWDELLLQVPKLTVRGSSVGSITRAGVALGGFQNVNHFKEIILSLLNQGGSDPLQMKDSGGQSAISFYTRFSNPTDTAFSWNTALPNSLDLFSSSDASIYFGLGSDLGKIKQKNPHLNFDVAVIPQIKENIRHSTFGRFYAVAVAKGATNSRGAFAVASLMAGRDVAGILSKSVGAPPTRRDLLSNPPSDPNLDVLYRSALIAHGWLDPDPGATSLIFGKMVESITSGRATVQNATSKASSDIGLLIK